jgi:hypothetical protein
MLPRLFANALGIVVDEQRPGSVRGVGGTAIIVHPGEAELEIAQPRHSFRWRAAVRFGSANHVLLGQLGCLEFFTARFDHYGRVFELEPNEVFPGHIE